MPKGTRVSVGVSSDDARYLAYYRSGAQDIGVLAPRDWYCFGTYGSGGDTLYVTAHPFDTHNVFSSKRPKLSGPAIQLSRRYGGTSGRFEVAEVTARVFPGYEGFVKQVIEMFSDMDIIFGPYPTDRLRYKSTSVVEYSTPPGHEGLGSLSWFEKDGNAIDGVAILVGPTSTPDLLLLTARLPGDQRGLTKVIVTQVEREAARLHSH